MAARGRHRLDAWLAPLLILLAAGAIAGASFEGLRWLHYACKPAATLAIIVRAAQGGRRTSDRSPVTRSPDGRVTGERCAATRGAR